MTAPVEVLARCCCGGRAMTDTSLVAAAVAGLVALGIGWLTGPAATGAGGAVAWSLAFAHLTADRAAQGIRS